MVDKRIILSASHVGKTITSGDQSLTILQDIDIEVTHGESIAILGASGSGKTTLLSLLAGLDLPSTGSIYFDSQQITCLSEDERAELRAKQLGFIFQSFQLMTSLTALENVMLPLELQNDKQAKEKSIQWLTRVGLGHRLHHQANHLSGGEQQRVAIARAFAIEPLLLFADEPTGNLDKQSAAIIMDLLFSLNEKMKTTLVVVTHDQSLANRCHRKLCLDNGILQ